MLYTNFLEIQMSGLGGVCSPFTFWKKAGKYPLQKLVGMGALDSVAFKESEYFCSNQYRSRDMSKTIHLVIIEAPTGKNM